MELLKTLKTQAGKYVIDPTALLIASHPVYTALETMVMEDDTSLAARASITALTYAGLGRLYTATRDISRRQFLNPQDAVKKHDKLCTAAFNLLLSPPLYVWSGTEKLEEIALGTAINVGIGVSIGDKFSYAVDVFRDFTGIEENKRLPKSVKNWSPAVKKMVLIGMVAASIGTCAAIYQVSPDEFDRNPFIQYIESFKSPLPSDK